MAGKSGASSSARPNKKGKAVIPVPPHVRAAQARWGTVGDSVDRSGVTPKPGATDQFGDLPAPPPAVPNWGPKKADWGPKGPMGGPPAGVPPEVLAPGKNPLDWRNEWFKNTPKKKKPK